MQARRRASGSRATAGRVAAGLLLVGASAAPTLARADEGGVAFWLSGQFGSLAAAPQQPGWTLGSVYYHTSLSGGGSVAVARQFQTKAFTRTAVASLDVDLKAHADLGFASATYVLATPILAGQLAVGLGAGGGYNGTSISGTLTNSVGNVTTTRSGSIDDARGGATDLYPQVSLRWNSGVHNFMVYTLGDIPVGTYDSSRLANFGIGHGAIDGGVGYTYLDPKAGHEFSVVTGLTGNFPNHSTDYRNGVDWHLDWAASQFLSKQWHVGVVGYVYKQLTADNNAPLILGANRSQVLAAGPEVGYFFPIFDKQAYLNLKAYREFDAEHRADGWNMWLTFAVSF